MTLLDLLEIQLLLVVTFEYFARNFDATMGGLDATIIKSGASLVTISGQELLQQYTRDNVVVHSDFYYLGATSKDF